MSQRKKLQDELQASWQAGYRAGKQKDEVELRELRKALNRACYIAEHLWQMVPQGVWREHGAVWQGQYEGDYHAEQVAAEIKALAASSEEPGYIAWTDPETGEVHKGDGP